MYHARRICTPCLQRLRHGAAKRAFARSARRDSPSSRCQRRCTPPSSNSSESHWRFASSMSPRPGPGEVLVKTEACGVCHTDLHAARGDWPVKPTLPFIPGHEGIGLLSWRSVRASRTSRRGRSRGCAVAVLGVQGTARTVSRAGRPSVPMRSSVVTRATADSPNTSSRILGSYVARVRSAALTSRRLPRRSSAPGSRRTKASSYDRRACPASGSRSPASAASGTSRCSTRRRWACRSALIDIDEGKLAHAKRLGADAVIDARTTDCIAVMKKLTGGGAHGVLVTATSLGAFKQAVAMTRKRGTCVLVGLPPGEFPRAAVRCRRELHHDQRLVRRHSPATWPKRLPLPPRAR